MNLAFSYLDGLLSDAEKRMDAAGIPSPKIVRERCPFCAGSGLREIGQGPLAKLDTCAACFGKGFVNVEGRP